MTQSLNLPQEAVEDYVKDKVLPKMGKAGRPFNLQPTSLGNRNKIFFLNIDDSGQYIFKGFTEKYRMRNALMAHDFLARHNISTPRVFFSDVTKKTFEKFGCLFSCEERIDGIPLAERANAHDEIPVIAEFFAHMHSVRSFRWGRLRKRQLFDFTTYTMRRIKERLDALHDSGIWDSGAGIDAARQWFARKKDSMKAIKRFSLCHGDVNPANILFTPNDRIVLIDNEAIKFLPFPIEYYRLQFSLCGDNPDAQRLFEENYFKYARPARRKELNNCGDFYKAYVMLEFAWHYNKKVKQHSPDDTVSDVNNNNKARALEAFSSLIG
jgi:serine/threonine protein kinase